MKLPLALVLLVACRTDAPALSAEDREHAMFAARQCTDTIDSLAPSYQMLGPKLAATLKMDRTEATRLMRDSVELLISTRELLCGMSAATVEGVLAKSPKDEQISAAHTRVQGAIERLASARKAYDALLGASTAAEAPVDQDALLDRFSHALIGH